MFKLLEYFGIDTSGFDRWGLALAGADNYFIWVFAAVALCAGIFWTASSVRDVSSRPRRYLLIFLQTIALLAVILILLQPSIRLDKVAKIKNRATVLLDVSSSMGLSSGDEEKTRADQALDFIKSNNKYFNELEKDYVVSYFGFDTELRDLPKRPEELFPIGDGTDIISALSQVSSEGSTPLAGVILISDGADTRANKNSDGLDDKRLAELISSLPAPVNTVVCGQSATVQDLAIIEVKHDDYGFVHNPFEVEITIRSEGSVAKQVPVIFKQGENVIASKTISLSNGQSEGKATLSFTPRQVGEFMFSVELPKVPLEVTDLNNIVRFPLKILRDKVRVLYIAGNPSWDLRFLRRALKKNPSVDLVSFYILREHWDDKKASQKEVSLIPFDTNRLFTEVLDTFDLIIWQNFRGPIYMPGKYGLYMQNLNEYVRDRGGALLMIGGHRGFFGGGRMDPLLEDMLPIIPSDIVPNYELRDSKVKVTELGLNHPIMMAGEGMEDIGALWGSLPALEGVNRVAKKAPGALVLANHVPEDGLGEGGPLIAVREVEAGRVMAVMTDCSWMWNFVAVGGGGGQSNKPYQRFWENSLRWLLQDPDMKLISLNADKGTVKPGEPVTILLEVLDESYKPTDNAAPKIEVVGKPGDREFVLPELERVAAGKYRIVVNPVEIGGYRLRASAQSGSRQLGHDDVIFEVAQYSEEWIDVMPKPGFIETISKETGGVMIKADGSPKNFAFKTVGAEQLIGSKDVPLWDNWPVLLSCFLIFAVYWFLRRKWGLH